MTPRIFLYQIDLTDADRHSDTAFELLTTTERNRAARFKVLCKRDQFIACRASLRMLLGQHCQHAPQSLSFACNERGKPQLEPDLGWQFNLSHSADCLLLACSPDASVGVDVEKIDPNIDIIGLSRRFFASDEYQAIMLHQVKARPRAFYICWTGKEAYLKCLGTGIDRALDTIVIGKLESLDEPVRKVHGMGDVHPERIHAVDVPEDYLGSLAVAAENLQLESRRCQLKELLG